MIKTPLLAVDIIIEYSDEIVLIKRKNDPFKGCYALPGGFVDVGENVKAAAKREAKEETELDIDNIVLIGIYSDLGRDPRGHIVSMCFFAVGTGVLCAGDDAEDAELFDPQHVPEMAFDHGTMIDDKYPYIR